MLDRHHQSKFVGVFNVFHYEAPSRIPNLGKTKNIFVNSVPQNG